MVPQTDANLIFEPNQMLQKFRTYSLSDISDQTKFLNDCAFNTVSQIHAQHGLFLGAQDWETMNWLFFSEHDCQFLFVADHDVTVYSMMLDGKLIHVSFSEIGLCVVSIITDLNILFEKSEIFKECNDEWASKLNRRYDLYRLCVLDSAFHNPVHSNHVHLRHTLHH